MGDGDPESAEAVTIEHVEVMTRRGPVSRAVYRPLLPEQPAQQGGSVSTTTLPSTEQSDVPDLPDIEPVNDNFAARSNKVSFGLFAVMVLSNLENEHTGSTLPPRIRQQS